MGTTVTYLAIKGLKLEEISRILCLTLLPDHKSGWDCIAWPMQDDFYVIENKKLALRSDDLLARLSANAEVLSGGVSESVMYCMASKWQGGKKVWSVAHHLDEGPEHLLVTGEPPNELESIVSRISAKRNATPEDERHDSFFSIPVELFQQLTGYKYNDLNLLMRPDKAFFKLPAEIDQK